MVGIGVGLHIGWDWSRFTSWLELEYVYILVGIGVGLHIGWDWGRFTYWLGLE